MKTVLILAPAWLTDHPPGNIAQLASFIKDSGHEVKCFDFNIRLFHRMKPEFQNGSTKISKDSWHWSKTYHWNNKQDVDQLISYYTKQIDGWVDEILAEKPDIAGFTLYHMSEQFSIEIAERIRRRSPATIIIFGGPLCFEHEKGRFLFQSTEALDYLCYTEGEYALSALCKTISEKPGKSAVPGFYVRTETGEVVKGDEIKTLCDLNELPFSDFSDFDLSLYTLSMLPVNSNRGCINRCAFCNESPFWGKFRMRTAGHILDEIKHQLLLYPGVKYVWFTDSLINGNIRILNELCDGIISEKLKFEWSASAYIRKEMDILLFNKMKAAGCNALFFGLESGSTHVLKLMRKGYSAGLAAEVLRDSAASGINTFINIIVGFPGEKHKHFIETVRFVHYVHSLSRINIASTSVNECYLNKGAALDLERKRFGIAGTYYDQWASGNGFNNRLLRKKKADFIRRVIRKKTHRFILTELIELYVLFPFYILIFSLLYKSDISLRRLIICSGNAGNKTRNKLIHFINTASRLLSPGCRKKNYKTVLLFLRFRSIRIGSMIRHIGKRFSTNLFKIRSLWLNDGDKIRLASNRLVKFKLKHRMISTPEKKQFKDAYGRKIKGLVNALPIIDRSIFLEKLILEFKPEDIVDKLENENEETLVIRAKEELNEK